jgi:hypothetical protein
MKKLCIVFITTLVSCMAFSQTTYTFTGNGNWSKASNWANNIIPPSKLPNGSSIFISPQVGDSCVLNTPHKNLPGSNMVISTGAKFIIRGGIGDYSDSADLVTRLKKVTYPMLFNLPIWASRGGEPDHSAQENNYFFYDSLNRLIEKKVIINRIIDLDQSIDTFYTFQYFYSTNSSQISRFTSRFRNTSDIQNHILTYDLQNRLIKDSINSPTGIYVTILTYLADTIIKYRPQVFPSGQQYFADTLIMIGNNVAKEKIGYGDYSIQKDFIVTAYRNPYSYANNFTLFGSDHYTYGSSIGYADTDHFITYNQCLNLRVNKRYNNIIYTPSNSHFTMTLDSFGRIKTMAKNTDYGNSAVQFEYY